MRLGISITVTIKKIRNMTKEGSHGRMVLVTMVIGQETKCTVKEFLPLLTGTNTMETINITSSMVKEFSLFLLEVLMTVTRKMVKIMVVEFTPMLVEIFMLAAIKMVVNMGKETLFG